MGFSELEVSLNIQEPKFFFSEKAARKMWKEGRKEVMKNGCTFIYRLLGFKGILKPNRIKQLKFPSLPHQCPPYQHSLKPELQF